MTERKLARKYLMKKGGRFISNNDESKMVTRYDDELMFECYDEKTGETWSASDVDEALDFFYGVRETKEDEHVINAREAAKIYLMGKGERSVIECNRIVNRWDDDIEFECKDDDNGTFKIVSDVEEALDFLFKTSDQSEAISTESIAIDSVTYEDQNPICIPVWQKYILSVEEAAEYFGMDEEKIVDLMEDYPGSNWIITIDGVLMVKRKLFAQFLDCVSAI